MNQDVGIAESPLNVVHRTAMALIGTGMLLLIIALAALGAAVIGLVGRSAPLHLLCAYSLLVLAGVFGGAFHILMGRAFENLNPVAYQWVRSTSWNPLVAVATGLGRRLDEPAVKELFSKEKQKAAGSEAAATLERRSSEEGVS